MAHYNTGMIIGIVTPFYYMGNIIDKKKLL
jgi:hypothetical protein